MESREAKKTSSSACGALNKKIQDMKNTLLLQAVRAGHADCVEQALSEGADVNASDTNLKNTVHVVFDCLNQFGVKLGDIQFDRVCRGLTAICIAVQNHALNCVESLIAAGANPNRRRDNGNTALVETIETAADYGFDDGCLQLMTTAGIDVNIPNTQNEGPLLLAVNKDVFPHVEQLIKAGADVNCQASEVLWYVVVEGTLSTLRSLVRTGIGINTSEPSVLTRFLETFGSLAETPVALTLAAAGEKIDEGSIHMPVYLNPKEKHLQHLCRIRKHLLNLDHLFNRIPRIPLPSLITDYLLYNVSLDDDWVPVLSY